MFTLNTYIEQKIDFIPEKETAKAGWWIRHRNNLILGKEYKSFATLASFKDPIVLYRTFNKDLILENGLSIENPVTDYSLFYLLHPPIPESKESLTWIITKGTYEFLLLIDHVDNSFIKKLKTYIPCNLDIDNKKSAKEFGLSFRQDYIYKNKKIGSIDSIIYNDGHYININLNGFEFTQEDRKDIDLLMAKYNDKSKFELFSGGGNPDGTVYNNIYNDLGGTDITFDQFKNHFIEYFKDIINFKICN